MVNDAGARRFVTDRYGPRASGLRALGAGEWSRAYALVLDGRDRVIRFGAYAEDFRKDEVMAAHSSPALPVPSVIEIGSAGDGYFAVSERAHGEPLDELDGAGMRAVLPSLLSALDAIAAVDVSGGRGYGIWAATGTARAATWAQALLAVRHESERAAGWRAALTASPTGAAPFDGAYARLVELVSALEVPRQLIHGDLLNRNVLTLSSRGDDPPEPPAVSARGDDLPERHAGSRISAVFDWGNAMYGDALYDAAWLIYWWPWYPQWQAIDITAEFRNHWVRRGGLPADLDRRLTACLLHIGLDAMSYSAFRGRWDDLARNASQLAALA